MAEPHTLNASQGILPRYLFLGGALAGRRVLEIGALSAVGIEGAQLCLELGAREVTTLGNAEEVRALDHLDLPPSLNLWEEDDSLPPRARFDLIAVHRAAALNNPVRREAWKARLNPTGHLVVAADGAFGRRGPSYAELVGPLKEMFPSVQVVLERPFFGQALVPFGVEGPPRLDARLARESPPSHYLLICGQNPLAVEGPAFMATVQPARNGATAPEHPGHDEHLREQLGKAHAAVREREQWLGELRVELEERDASLASREHDARVAAGQAATAQREAEAYREDRDHARQQLKMRSDDLATALARATSAETERDDLRKQAAPETTATAAPAVTPDPAEHEKLMQSVAELRQALEQARAEVDSERERGRRGEAELEDAAARDVQLARELRSLGTRLTAAEQRAEGLQAQLEKANAELTRSEGARQELETELGRLISDLREAPVPVVPLPGATPAAPPPAEGPARENTPEATNDEERERLRIALRDREERLALLRRELTDKAERISRLLEELQEAKTKGLRLFNR
jgi:predicted  nucleic acid-binding Zn-ribbon protein